MNASENSILIADDDEMGREMLSRRLERAGYLTTTAADGRRALELLAIEHYDLVLLDLMMPGMDGFQVLEAMMETEKTCDIPVIILTALGDRQSTARCVALGACDYLLKPIEIGVVKTRVWQAMEKVRYGKPVKNRLSDDESVTGRLLLVEDDESNMDILKRRVEKLGCNTECARDGMDAIKLIAVKGKTYDLIMLDISMPKVDGLDVLRFIRSNPELKDIPVIIVSAVTDSKTVFHALKSGASDFVMKPYNAVELSIRVKSCLRMKQVLDTNSERTERIQEFTALGEKTRSKNNT